MLCLNFDFYIIPLTLLLTFLKQYVMCMLLAEKNVNPEEQVSLSYIWLARAGVYATEAQLSCSVCMIDDLLHDVVKHSHLTIC